MENTITEGSKLIAEYLGWKYIPFSPNNDIKAGWYEPEKMLVKGKRTKIGYNFYTYACRKHNELRFYNSMDALIPVIKKLENEDLGEYFYQWEFEGELRDNFQNIEFTLYNNGGYSEVNLDLDPSIEVAKSFDEKLSWTQNVFNLVVETIKYVNKVKNK